MSKTIGTNLPSEEDLKRQIMLTSAIVWKHELNDQEIEKWLNNFEGRIFNKKYERQLALWLLANFVFYNENEVRHLCKTLYSDFIHSMLFLNSSNHDIISSVDRILKESKFYHLGRPGESGSFILYYFRQENNIPLNNFIFKPDDLPSNISTIVFIDDVTLSRGSHGQAIGYIEQAMEDYFKGKNSVLLTFIATEDAIKSIESSGTKVITSIKLDQRSKCFSDKSNVFHFFSEHLENCKKLSFEYGKTLKPSYPLGYNDGQYLFGFFYNTPDNSLPIFWCKKNGWYPIIKRYEKNYNKVSNIEHKRFI